VNAKEDCPDHDRILRLEGDLASLRRELRLIATILGMEIPIALTVAIAIIDHWR